MQYYYNYMNAKRGKNGRSPSMAFCLNRILLACTERVSALYFPNKITYHDCEQSLYTGESVESAAMRAAEFLDPLCAKWPALDAYLEESENGETARFYAHDPAGNTLGEVFFPLFRGIPDRVVGDEPDNEALLAFVEDALKTARALR